MGNGLENQKTFEFPRSKNVDKSLPGEQYTGLNKKVLDFIVKLTVANFYGKVTLTFESGEVKHIEQYRSIKP